MEAALTRSGASCCSAYCAKVHVSFVPRHASQRQCVVKRMFQRSEPQNCVERRRSLRCLSRAAETDREKELLARDECPATSESSHDTAVRQQSYQLSRLAGAAALLSLLLVANSADAAEVLPLDVFAAFLV